MKKGLFIVLDGGEGCGKSTLLEYLKSILPNDKNVFTREPGGSPYAEDIRSLMLTHPLAKNADGNTHFGLVWAARADHLKNTVRPALLGGQNVISDRFDSSTWAYQIHGQKALHLKDLFMPIRKVFVGDTAPDLYIFLDVPPQVGMKRVAGRKGDPNHFDDRKIDFHETIRQAYKDFPKEFPQIMIDTNKPLEDVKAELKKIILEKIM